ncbi:peptide ABC transporter substrate-binding protein [Phenylobacterium sp.]|uniref:peptide ABC transporter substrate-binding protein n=1 Tax=Phenylobacterium sp. TaxID=1871053 RepID=UPI0037CB7899
MTGDTDRFGKAAGRQLLLIAAASILGVALLMFGLSWASNQAGGGRVGKGVDAATGTVTLALADEPPQLDSTRSTDTISSMVLGHVTEGLIRNGEGGALLPGVAERWEITPTRATFWLRADARWSDGKPVTAHDFVFAWRKAVDPKTASEYATIFFSIKNAEAINKGQMPLSSMGVVADGDRVLKVELVRPVAYFDKLMVFKTFNPIREDFYNAMKGRYGADADTLLYNGPFKITRWVHGASLRMEKNPTYWDKDRVKLNVLDFAYFSSDPNALINLYKDGKIAVAGLNQENLNEAMLKRWPINRFQRGAVAYLEFNHREGRPTANIHLRRAIQLIVDPDEIVYRVIKLPGNIPARSLFPIWLDGVEGKFREEYPVKRVIPNADEARRQLALAKKQLGVDKIPPLTLLSDDGALGDKLTEYYQETFRRELGLEIRIDKQIFKQRLAKMSAGDFDIVSAGWNPDYPDPLTFADLYASWNSNNRGRYKNARLDQLVEIAQTSTDVRTRMDAFGEIQNILVEDPPMIPTYEPGVVYIVDPRLKGVVRRVAGFDPDYTGVSIVGK